MVGFLLIADCHCYIIKAQSQVSTTGAPMVFKSQRVELTIDRERVANNLS